VVKIGYDFKRDWWLMNRPASNGTERRSRMSRINGLIGAACAVALVACTTATTTPQPSVNVASSVNEEQDRVERSNVVTVTAIVEKIDLASRMVTLRGPEGKVTTMHVDESARNLPQVRKGDQVTVAYYESIVYQVRSPGDAKVGDTSVVEGGERAAVGEKPGGVGARAVTIVTKVEAIDKVDGTITLKGPEGETKTLKAENPANLDKVKVGDLIEITYTEAVAISVDKP
jgi:hypothetical protein